jgi:C4-dicarboxylate-specific signal transduction histidine kinase
MVLSSLEESIHKNDTVKSQENLALLKKQLISLTQVVSKLNQLSDITESHAIVKPFLVSECIDSVRLILAKRLSNVQFSFQGDCQLQGSKELFTSIMLNIITNALDEFMLNRISVGKIEIDASPSLISIKDNGTGFDNQTAKKLSDGEMFSTKDMGSGLGLYLVRESLKSFSGKLQIENSKDGANIQLIFKSKRTVN